MGAPSFKDCVAADIHGVFLNNQEFASTHTIDGKEMDAVVDDNALLERDAARGGVHSDGIYKVRRLLYVSRDDYGGRPPSGKRLVLDGRSIAWSRPTTTPVCWPLKSRRSEHDPHRS